MTLSWCVWGVYDWLWPPLSDICFLDPHDITRYFVNWYDNRAILAIFHVSWLGKVAEKKSVKSMVFCQEGGSRRAVKKQTSILERHFFSKYVESFQDPQNMFYTWSGVFWAYIQLLKQLWKWHFMTSLVVPLWIVN